MSIVQPIKDKLVDMGAGNPVTQLALRFALGQKGFRLGFASEAISLTANRKTILLRSEDLSFVPVVAEMHPHFFEMLEADKSANGDVLDFTKPRVHKYVRTGLEVLSSTIAEDDSMPEYTKMFTPQAGMTVFDIGAHAGLTTLELSRMVGPSGHVYAFEPDREARSVLERNLERYDVSNVTVRDEAIGEVSGEAAFRMDGTQAAGLVDSLVYTRADCEQLVRVMTLEEACDAVGAVPTYIKTDIEGAELGMVRGSIDFIKNNPMHLAFETHRLRDGTFTHDHLIPLLSSAGYRVEHAVPGFTLQNFLYATPAAA